MAKECIDVLDGMRVGVRVTPPASALPLTPLGLALAKESIDVLFRFIDLLVYCCHREAWG